MNPGEESLVLNPGVENLTLNLEVENLIFNSRGEKQDLIPDTLISSKEFFQKEKKLVMEYIPIS